MNLTTWARALAIAGITMTAACSGADDAAEDVDQSEGELAGSVRGIDTNGSTLDIAFAKSRGVSFVARYLSFDGAHPPLSAEEVARFRAGGMPLVAVWETGQKRAIETGSIQGQFELGAKDAHAADNALKRVGAPGKPIYFTVDFDVEPSFWNGKTKDAKTHQVITHGDLIDAYFHGIDSVVGASRAGAYGTYTTVKELFDGGRIHWGWQQTFGGRGAKVEARAQLRQYDIYPDQTGWGVAGAGALDMDRAVKTSFGQF
jgi:hypothetical protein